VSHEFLIAKYLNYLLKKMKSIKEIFQNINTLYLNKYNSAKLNNFTGFYFEHIYYEIAKKIFEIYTEKINVLQSKYTPKKKDEL